MSYTDLKDYLNKLRDPSPSIDGVAQPEVRIHWPSIDIDGIEALPSQKRRGLQIADSIATSTRMALESLSPKQDITDSYIDRLLSIAYRHNKRTLFGYGLKFFPREAEDHMKSNSAPAWMKRHKTRTSPRS